MSETITISSGALSAAIDTLGAELVSLRDHEGREWMTDADPQYWTGHAPVLFPIVGELAGGCYRIGEQVYAMARHGFARRRTFACEEYESSALARFRLEDDEDSRASYPFRFALELCYRIEANILSVVATVINRGAEAMPFSIGFHPGFAWPLPGGGAKRSHVIDFAENEPAPIARLDDGGLLGSTEPSPVVGNRLSLTPELFEDDAVIFTTLASRSLTYRGENGAGLDIAFPDTPMLGIWQKPGADFLCIEPWAGVADPAGYAGQFADKRGIMLLPAGESRRFRMTVTVHPARQGER